MRVLSRPSVSRVLRGARSLAFVLAVGFASVSVVASAGCTLAPPVRPWQRGYLSKRALRFDGDRLEQRFRQHMLGSREGSDLGFGQPGGGCGCN
jgi:hypothetical protein